MLSKLFVKNMGKVMKPWYKQISAYSDLPAGIHSYDVVKGFSAKKGNFIIKSYKNKNGKLLYRESSYTDKDLVITKNFDYNNYLTYVQTKTNQSGILTKNKYKTLRAYDDGSFIELSEQIGATPLLDKQMVRYLKSGESPKVINVDNPWGDTKITSPKCTLGRMTMLKNRKYLPTLISNRSKERINKRIKSIENTLSHRNNLPTSRTQTQRVSQKVLNPESCGTVFGDCNYLGKVRIWDKLYTTPDLYETMGHEFNHSKWFQCMDDFECQSIGIGSREKYFTAKKLLEEEVIIEQIPYEKQTMECLAFAEEPKVKKVFWEDMFDNTKRFFDRL